MWALDPHERSERFECKGREWLAKDSCPWRKLNSLDIQQIESIVARNRRGKYIFLRHAGPDKFDLVLKSEAGIWMRIWFSKKLERRVWRMDAALQRLRCYCTIASETKQQHEAEFPDAQRSCKCLQFEQLWALWSLASGFEEIKLVCSSWSVTWRKTNDGSKMKHPVHETDFLCRHKLLFLRVWPRSSQTVPVSAGRHCHCSLGVQPADLETSASCSDTWPWRHLNGGRQSSWGKELAWDVRSDKSSAPAEYR